MPRVARSPPPPVNSPSHTTGSASLCQSHSEPSLVEATETEHVNTQSRNKRFRSDFSPDKSLNELNDFKLEFKEEIKSMLSDWNETNSKNLTKIIQTQNTILNQLVSEVAELKKQNSEIQKTNLDIEKSMNFMNSQYEEVKGRVETLERERSELKEYAVTLENKIKDLQFSSRSACIEIRNFPSKDKETYTDLVTNVTKIGSIINMDVPTSEIRDIRRLPGKPGTYKPIVAEFTNVQTKNNFLARSREYNKNHIKPDKLNTTLIGLPGDRQPIYVDEYLPLSSRKLMFQAREFAKTMNYNFCWSSNGNIFLRKEPGAKQILIRSTHCLAELRNQK